MKHASAQLEDLRRKHELAMQDLDEYGAFLNALQALFDDNAIEGLTEDGSFTDFERYASHAVQSFLETVQIGGESNAAKRAIAKHECAAALVNSAGIIQQVNMLARMSENLVTGESLSNCGIRFSGEDDIAKLLHARQTGEQRSFHLVQAESSRLSATVTLAVSEVEILNEETSLFLVLFIAPPDARSASELLTKKFDLTQIEKEITIAFLEGVELRDIAHARKRSYITIRNQFQRILDKTGCTSQIELYRLSFSLLLLIGGPVNEPVKLMMSGNTMKLPRPNRRVVELVLNGDETGQPILSFHSLFGHGITPKSDAILRDRGVCLISLMRPGFGNTSTPLRDQELYDCVAKDVRAVLDSLEIEHCPCIARASAARPFYNLLAHLPDRISRGVVVNGMIPTKYIKGKTIVSKWTNALMSASIVSYPIANLILGTGHNLFMRSNGASFLKKMYQNSLSDCASFDDADVVTAIRLGVHQITQQGLGAGVQEMVDAFKNWETELQAIQTPITLYHGCYDPNVPIAGVREFARDNAHCLTFVEETEGGGLLSFSHFGKLIDLALEDSAS